MPHLYSRSSSLPQHHQAFCCTGHQVVERLCAKALAHESGATFINLHISTLTGEMVWRLKQDGERCVSLARKLQPSIVFIDEIDAAPGMRRSGEHEASGMVKAEFMTHWMAWTRRTRPVDQNEYSYSVPPTAYKTLMRPSYDGCQRNSLCLYPPHYNASASLA
jgi:hypothetical protein